MDRHPSQILILKRQKRIAVLFCSIESKKSVMRAFNIYSFSNFLIYSKYSAINCHHHGLCHLEVWNSVPLTLVTHFVPLPPLTCGNKLPCPPPGDLPDPGIEPGSAALQADSLASEPPGKPMTICRSVQVAANGCISLSFRASNILLCIFTTSSVSFPLWMDT